MRRAECARAKVWYQLSITIFILARLSLRAQGARTRYSRGHHTADGFFQCLHSKNVPVDASLASSAALNYTPALKDTLPSNWSGCMLFACNATRECRDIHHTMALRVMAVLSCAESQWFAFDGTLLGLARNQSLFPNDMDMDVDVVVNQPWFDDFARPGSMFVRALDSLGYHVLKDGDILRVCVAQGAPGMAKDPQAGNISYIEDISYTDHYNYIDVYRMRAAAYEISYHARPFPAELLLPLQTIDYQGHKIAVPALPETILTSLYGEWHEVHATKHGTRRKRAR